MRFVKATWQYFGEDIHGIVLDNSYDEYNRNEYVKHVKKEGIRYLCAQDTDMRMVASFEDIEFLKIPPEAEYLEALRSLKSLKGIWVCSEELAKMDLSWFPTLQELSVFEMRYFKRRKALKIALRGTEYKLKRRRRKGEVNYEEAFVYQYFVKRKS